MGLKHLIRLGSIIFFQAVMVAALLYFASSSRRFLSGAFAVAALVLPFVGNIAAVYNASLFAKWPKLLKVSVLTLFSIMTTLGTFCAFGFIWRNHLEKNSVATETVLHGNPSEGELVQFLDSDYEILVANTLTTLEHRRLAGGKEKAAKLLDSRNPSIWYGAALYLGSLGDQRSVPYLIRGLNHPAWRSRQRVVNYLQTLTRQNYGDKKEDWMKWWLTQNKDRKFDFTCITTQEWRNRH